MDSKNRIMREIARYPISSDSDIYLMAGGPVSRDALETLVARLSLQLEIDEFDDRTGSQKKSYRLQSERGEIAGIIEVNRARRARGTAVH